MREYETPVHRLGSRHDWELVYPTSTKISAMKRDQPGRRASGRQRHQLVRTVVGSLLLVLPAAFGPIGLSGCGGSGTSIVASVQGREISKGELSHWDAIKRAELRSSSRPSQTPDEAELRQMALAFLITSAWLQGEAAAQGVRASQAEVATSYAQLLDGPAGRSFAAGMKRRGLSRADELFLLRLAKLGARLRMKIEGAPGSAEGKRRFSAFIVAYRQRWKQRTTCQRGYRIPECRNGPPQGGIAH